MVSGEASLGYGVRDYRDPRLPDAGAPLFDASLIWSVTPLTTVTLKAVDAIAGRRRRRRLGRHQPRYTINLDHALTERVKLGLSGGFGTDHYVGIDKHDRSYTLGATAEYHLSREVVLKASATHQQFVSNVAGVELQGRHGAGRRAVAALAAGAARPAARRVVARWTIAAGSPMVGGAWVQSRRRAVSPRNRAVARRWRSASPWRWPRPPRSPIPTPPASPNGRRSLAAGAGQGGQPQDLR